MLIIIKKFGLYLAHMSLEFFPLINVKMPTIVGILTFMSEKSFNLSSVEHEKSFITSGPVYALFVKKVSCKVY